MRQEAEHAVFDEFLEYFEEWKARDTEWKKANPIRLEVEKNDANQFRVIILPDLSTEKQRPAKKKRRNRNTHTDRGEETLIWEGY